MAKLIFCHFIHFSLILNLLITNIKMIKQKRKVL